MASNPKDPVLVVLQLSGGNDGLNTVIPYSNPLYYDNRPKVGIPEDQVLAINDSIGFHPAMGPMKELYNEGKVAIIQGIGYPKPSRSHFRSMDIWHTCEPMPGKGPVLFCSAQTRLDALQGRDVLKTATQNSTWTGKSVSDHGAE